MNDDPTYEELQRLNARMTIEAEVRNELRRQDEKWGEQNHANGTGPSELLYYEPRPNITYESLLEDHREANETSEDMPFWDWILLEEVFEALSENDTTKLRSELIQVAAVAQQWIQAIDRRTTTNER